MTVIEFNDVTKTYGKRIVLNKMTFSIRHGVLTGIIGRNGVGKSTVMKIIAGHIQATSGDIRVFSDKPFNSLKVSANSILVDDTMSFSDKLTLKDILKEADRFYPNWDAPLAQRLFDYFSFHSDARQIDLSKGKKSTFNAIIGLASHCPLTIFDEPTTGMDTVVRKDFYRALLKDYIAHPRTILLSSHHLEEIEDLLENILLIHNKTALFHGPVTDLQEMFVSLIGKNELISTFIADIEIFSSQINGSFSEILVKNNFTPDEIKQLHTQGIQLVPVSADDAYVALTTGTKGGIDHVFNGTLVN
ncbi:ABC transporter ATP-binding protein [Sporosarcina sp. E16_8]|uniref:ATP-binding cassette domain-containing protein n=1 Tax=Sporosarcina sp. E16_8 TaxID=2789295 RepID=UPI001A912472|nr:ABC transporter ATP-binding protein [Sporosarcina sp. E16_8]MBO0586815.1 ABC transporter ATP-binding protein [Sporosarcina sp. E16_8]